MAKGESKGPRLTTRGQEELAARRDREARALRENLRKRTVQRRGQAEPNPAPSADAGRPNARPGPEGEA